MTNETATKLVNVFCKERWEGDWPPEDADGCLAWLKSKLTLVPPEFLPSAIISFESRGGDDGDHTPSIEIHYRRPFTEQEQVDATEAARRHTESVRARELAQLAALQQKYAKS